MSRLTSTLRTCSLTRPFASICYLKVKGDNSSRTRYGICYLEGHFPNYNVSQTVWVELADKADYTRTVPAHFEEILQRPIVYGQVPLTTRLLNSFRCQ